MIRSLFTSSTGLNAQSTVIDNTANNLANVNTNGFKKSQVDFQDLLYVTEKAPGSDTVQGQQVPSGTQIGTGVRVAGTTKVYITGSVVPTQNPLDVAIEGEGFLKIRLPNGEDRYTRDGALRLNSSGNLVNTDGFLIQPQVTVPPDTKIITVGSDGSLTITNGANVASNQGQLSLFRFPNPSGLSSEGRNLLAETASSGRATSATPGSDGTGFVRGGFLERSNVDVVTEMVNLILAQRAYEFNLRSIRAADEMLSNTTNLTR